MVGIFKLWLIYKIAISGQTEAARNLIKKICRLILILCCLICSDSEADIDVTTPTGVPNKKVPRKRLPKPKYHTPGTSQGVMASAARPRFSSSEGEDEYVPSGGALG